MKTVGLFDAKTRLSELCREVGATGEEVVITRRGQVIARLLPPTPAAPLTPRVPGRFEGQFRVADGIFFAPLPDAELAAWEGGAIDSISADDTQP